MRTAAVMLGLLIGSIAQGVQPFSWDVQWNTSSLTHTDEMVIPDGMHWVVEWAYGSKGVGGGNTAGFDAAEVWQGNSGDRIQAMYIVPTLVYATSNFTAWNYTQPVRARYSGRVQVETTSVLAPTLSLIGYLTPTLAGDYSGDGIVNAADYTVLRDNAASWEPSDLALFQSHYGSGGQSSSSPIPEPTASTLLALALLGLTVRRVASRSALRRGG